MASTQVNEKTSLKSEQNPGYGGSPSIDSVEGLTPSGLFINPCQWLMIGLYTTVSFVFHLAALIVGFVSADIRCDHIGSFVEPSSYLRMSGVVGIFVSVLLTAGLYHNYFHHPQLVELAINGKIFEINANKNIIFIKAIAMTMVLGSSFWCIVGWIIIHDLNTNECGNDLLEHTILAWTVSQIIFMICALLSRFARKSPKIKIYQQESYEEEGSVQNR